MQNLEVNCRHFVDPVGFYLCNLTSGFCMGELYENSIFVSWALVFRIDDEFPLTALRLHFPMQIIAQIAKSQMHPCGARASSWRDRVRSSPRAAYLFRRHVGGRAQSLRSRRARFLPTIKADFPTLRQGRRSAFVDSKFDRAQQVRRRLRASITCCPARQILREARAGPNRRCCLRGQST